MIDYMWFDRSKWDKTLQGRSVAIPANTNLYVADGNTMRLAQKFSGKAGTYFLSDKVAYYKIRYNNQDFYVKESDLENQNGGVTNSLSHLYRAFHLVRKELSVAIKEMIFNGLKWLPEVPGNWYKCEGHNDWGYVWLWYFDDKTSQWRTVYKTDGPDEADTLSKDVIVRVDDKNIVTYNASASSHYRLVKITQCPSRPNVVGKYLSLDDLVLQNGGGN